MSERPRTFKVSSLLTGILAATTLALGGCAFQLPIAQPTPIQTSGSASRAPDVAKPDVATPSSETPAEVGTGTPGATAGTGGPYGEFSSLSEACLSVSAAMVSVTILPLAALVGGNSEDIETAKQELAKMQAKVPDELKPSFEKLRVFTEAAGTDFSKYGEPEFEQLMKPIQDWMDKNCT